MSSEPSKAYVITAALIRRDDQILLVHEQGPNDPRSHWVLPGGRVEDGELITDGLIREVREETGLQVLEIGKLLYAMQSPDVDDRTHLLSYVLEVTRWTGELRPDDPDGLILEATFLPEREAIVLLKELPWSAMSAPIIAYLEGTQPARSLWLFQRVGGQQTLIAALPTTKE